MCVCEWDNEKKGEEEYVDWKEKDRESGLGDWKNGNRRKKEKKEREREKRQRKHIYGESRRNSTSSMSV